MTCHYCNAMRSYAQMQGTPPKRSARTVMTPLISDIVDPIDGQPLEPELLFLVGK